MIVYFLEQKYEVNPQEILADKFLLDMQNQLNESQRILSYVVLNNEKIFSDISRMIEERWKSIEELEFVTMTFEEHVIDIINESHNYLEKAIPIISYEADAFYKSVSQENWIHLKELFDSIQWILESINHIEELGIIIEDKEFQEYSQKSVDLQQIIPEFLDAMENEDTTLIGDLLKYELIPILRAMHLNLDTLLKSGS